MESFNSMDMTKLDLAAAATRQKSCNACVRGKRRCDKKTPRCTRCAAKGLDCLYKKLPSGGSTSPSTTNVSASNMTMGGTECSDVADFDMSFDIESLRTDTSPESLQTDVGLQLDPAMDSAMDPALDFNIADLMAGSAADMWNFQLYGEPNNKLDLPAVPLVPARKQIRDLVQLRSGECLPVDPMQVHDPRTGVGYITAYLTSIHEPFAQTRELPFMHPRLWCGPGRMPQTILAAFSAATAYAGRTPQTRPWVLKLLADAAREVHRDGDRPGLSAGERLARVQALVVLSAVRVFDGDVGVRAAAEREMGVLSAWVEDLTALRDELAGGVDPEVSMSRESPPPSWESWILLESVRRTIIMTFCFMCLFFSLKAEEGPTAMMADGMAYTASRHLWEATSSVEFYRAWREKHQFCVTINSFKEFWMYARPDDLDEFTKLLLTAQFGPDVVDHFLLGETTIPVPNSS